MSEIDDEDRIYSISLRLRRVTYEYAFVKVPVTDAVIDQQPDGSGRLNGKRVFDVGVELGRSSEVVWYPEEQSIEPHPLQTPPPQQARQ
jgi:hypothetical protein